MSIQFSEGTNNTGIVQQTRFMMRVDSSQWPTAKIVNSCNNWLDFVAGYAIGADKRFDWDDTNHTKLPIGTTDIVLNQSDYSFLSDEQGNKILTLLEVNLVESSGRETPLIPIDREDNDYLPEGFGITSGRPTRYDKLSDNIIRLDTKPDSDTVSTYDLKFYFQRTPSYFAATDTTKTPGIADTLHRGFVIASAYDGALTLGLPNLQALAVERAREEQRVKDYFGTRSNDERKQMTMRPINFR